MLFETFKAHIPCEYRVKLAIDPWEQSGAAALRRAVFCREQDIFQNDDRDDIDAIAIPIVAIACVGGMPDQVIGTVRIHQPEPGLWYGSRLAVDADFRRVHRIGASLIRLAVSTAHARGCRRFLAYVQSQNAKLFHRLHWHTLEEVEMHGHPHHFMQADLDYYPPFPDGATGFALVDQIREPMLHAAPAATFPHATA